MFGRLPRADEVVQELRRKVAEQDRFITQVKAGPRQLANVVRLSRFDGRRFATVASAIGTLSDVPIDVRVGDLEPGDYVWQSQSGGVIGRAPSIDHLGISAPVVQVISEHAVEIEGPGGARVVAWSSKRFPKVAAGSQVLIDRGGCVVVGHIPSAKGSEYVFDEDTGITWDDIGGLEDAKRQLREAIELPAQHPELYRAYGKRAIRGVLLEGPPRCGKTMLAKAVSTSVRKAGGGGGFFYLAGPEVLDRFVGVAEGRVRGIFDAARAYRRERGHSAVIFLDEADALLSARGSSPFSHVQQTMVPQFLAEMDGVEESGAVVLLATNRASDLDPAVTGHGRVDRTIHVPRPTSDVARVILELALREVPVASEASREQIVEAAVGELYADHQVVREAGPLVLRLRDVVNGAMVRAAVDVASSRALARDVARDGAFADGITVEDVREAVGLLTEQERHKNHSEAAREVVDRLRVELKSAPTEPEPGVEG